MIKDAQWSRDFKGTMSVSLFLSFICSRERPLPLFVLRTNNNKQKGGNKGKNIEWVDMNVVYLYGVPCFSLLLCITCTCWWWQRKRATCWSSNQKERVVGNHESKPLLSARVSDSIRQRRVVSNVIAKFETQEAVNKNIGTTKPQEASLLLKRKSKVAPHDTIKNEKKPVDRCPACRKIISSTTTAGVVHFQDQKIHLPCFKCCDCQTNLQDHEPETVQEYASNVRVKFQCQTCSQQFNGQQQQHNQSAVKHNIGRVVVGDHEQGDMKQAMEKIGHDLTEAVYFMHPKCSVCGGDFQDKEMARETKGNWRYHPECWDKGRPTVPEEMKTYNKLLPAPSAKYLPAQIIVQLWCPSARMTSSAAATNTSKRNGKGESSSILTTLYFVWKNKEEHTKQLRQVNKNDTVVNILYSLDEQAPANPNYTPHSDTATTQPKKKQRQAQSTTETVVALPAAADANNSVKDLQLKLLAADEVAPRPPTMMEPVSIVHGTSTVSDGYDTDAHDNGGDGDSVRKSFLCAKLEYLKFGLHYMITLRIPLEDESTCRSASSGKGATDEGYEVNLVGALLSVTIEE